MPQPASVLFDRSRMKSQTTHSVARVLAICLAALAFTGCKKLQPPPDHPRLTSAVTMRDVTFHSAALDRDMQYRIVLPASLRPDERAPAIYLLHGGGGGFRDWTNYSDVGKYAEQRLILVMPEGDESYWVNSATKPNDRYEDYVG